MVYLLKLYHSIVDVSMPSNIFYTVFYVVMELLKPSQPTTTYKPPLSPILRQELRKFNQYQKQFRLLHDENIHTVPEFEVFIAKLSKQLDDLDSERKRIDNKRRRAKTYDETKEYYFRQNK